MRAEYNKLFHSSQTAKDYACRRGELRVYLPHLDLSNKKDPINHRFFTESMVAEKWPSTDDFIESLVGSFSGRQATRDQDIIDLDDIERERRRIRYKHLRNQADERINNGNVTIEELEKLLEIADSENAELDARLKQEVKRANASDKKCDELELLNEELEDKARRAKQNQARAEKEAQATKEQALFSQKRAQTLDSLTNIPRNSPQVLKLIEAAYDDRMVVLEEAYRSSKVYKEGGKLLDQWELLMTLPTILWPLLFDRAKEPLDLEGTYSSSSHCDLAMHEGATTRRNQKMMAERDRRYHGQTIRCEPHIRTRERRSDFRVYFWVDQKRQLIVIGHCGKHLTTAGTDKQR